MRVLIDASPILLRSAGVKSYTYHWIRSLRRAAGTDSILAFPFLKDLGGLNHEHSPLSWTGTTARLGLLYLANLAGSSAIDWLSGGAGLFHMSNQLRTPPRRIPITATLHDMTCFLMPELHTPANVRADREFARRVLGNARRLIAVSENTRQDAIRTLALDPEKIDVVHSGVAESYFEARPGAGGRPYALFVGTIEPRKNVDTLLDAWHLLPGGLRDQFDLVVAGASGWSSAKTLARLESGLPGIRYLRYVPELELPQLTAGAAVLAYPSLYEGFGFPVAQAMACGVPVVTSRNSCLPEIAGDGALYADPRSPLELSAAIGRVLESSDLRAGLGAAGRSRAEHYHWDRCARESLEFFRRALG